ncbi:TetR/AcrR family transcriptional regulator [Demequina sp. NBRC 110052]|uniref:TetR/AcrR family transcriptional regulator n=1 Tax=Demequina sp. NBRC 110052 TaxID=1570341 RepID=UPI000A075935|nr:TetR/AcrR family transcriptional regulator C-terminal domain-containing protein [Demequina sp. NBRC 110052]
MAATDKRTRTRATHSMEAVVTEAVALLDAAGESALTFRALAARLGGGVGSIYWYVSNKDELLDRASDHVLADVLAATEDLHGPDPLDDARTIAVTLFDTIVQRSWLAAYFMRDGEQQPNALRLYDRLGRQVMRLGLSARDTFNAVSAIVGFVIGTAADLSQQHSASAPDAGASGQDLEGAVAQWRALDGEAFPYLHFILDEFAAHDDGVQFRAGLDLLLAGIRLQAADSHKP